MTLLEQSGQRWKFSLLVWGSVAGFGLMLAGMVLLRITYAYFALVLGGLVLGAASFVFASLSIRCPRCGQRWFWRAVSRRGPRDWYSALEKPRCDGCGVTKTELS